MAGGASPQRALCRVVAGASFSQSTPLGRASSARIRRCHLTNCATFTTTTSSSTRWKGSRILQSDRRLQYSSPTASIPTRRKFSSTPVSQHGDLTPPKPGEERKITFIDQKGDQHTYEVADGDNLLDIAQHYGLEMEGACGGSCACSTCHVIVESDHYDKMEEPDDDENDMLDLAFGLTETSRLGCQIKMREDLDGLVVKLPSMTRNLQARDFENK
ncbi:ferredoxin [Lojkania enalia]|uniref:Ferredoxin n=1 Tax=Lojkania enalia TaxID=147567 RepID=A0A9P4N4V5_9PLEO|nr:ferredoxin [Didymosphaeria enalia]